MLTAAISLSNNKKQYKQNKIKMFDEEKMLGTSWLPPTEATYRKDNRNATI